MNRPLHAASRTILRKTLPAWLVLSLLAGGTLPARAQVTLQGPLKNFRLPDYYPASPNRTNQVLKTLLSGAEARQVRGGLWQIIGLRIETFSENGPRELEIKASECLLDIPTRQASGPGHLQVVTANGLYAIEGDGFQWQSNSVLVISNHVLTTLQRGVLAFPSAPLEAGTNAAPGAAPPATNDVIRIRSEHCVFDSQSNRVVQSGQVQVDDPQMRLSCGTLTAQFTPERRLRELVAEDDVSVLNLADQSRVTADRGTYQIQQDREILSMLGQPVWRDRDGRQEVKAARFTFDRTSRAIRGEGGAVMRLPRGTFSQPSLGLERPAAPTPAPVRAVDTNEIQISSETLTLLLPTTNRPARTATAETGVVILSPADDTRATGDKAVYREESGLLELMGRARWEAEGRLVSADRLVMDRTNKIFFGRGHSLFRQPLHPGARGISFRVSTNRAAATNLVLEIQSDDLTYRTNALVFEGGTVFARVLEGQELRGVARCGLLTAWFSNYLERVVAEKHVVAENYPPVGKDGRVVTNLLTCETLTAAFAEDSAAITLRALENVQAAQVQARPAGNKALVTDLTCGLLTVVVRPKAGKVESIQAEQHVVISQEDKQARGGRAVYTDKENRVVLSEHPEAEFAEGRVCNAEVLIWDRATGGIKGLGRHYRIEWTKPAGGTNALRLPILKK